jgi:hypothetical protein
MIERIGEDKALVEITLGFLRRGCNGAVVLADTLVLALVGCRLSSRSDLVIASPS